MLNFSAMFGFFAGCAFVVGCVWLHEVTYPRLMKEPDHVDPVACICIFIFLISGALSALFWGR